MIIGLLKALFLTTGPGIVVFILAQFMKNREWLVFYTIAVTALVFYLYIKVYAVAPAEDSHGWVFSHALVHCIVIVGSLGIFMRSRKLARGGNRK